MSDINKVPDSGVIAQRIFEVVSVRSDIEREIVMKILSEWNEQWVAFVAETKTGIENNAEEIRATNQERLDKRMKSIVLKRDNIAPKFREDTV